MADFMADKWITGCVLQGCKQHFGSSRWQFDADQPKRKRTDVNAMVQATGFSHRCEQQADDLLAFQGFEKLPDAFPVGGHAGAKVGSGGKD
jgi:hypothetical protein